MLRKYLRDQGSPKPSISALSTLLDTSPSSLFDLLSAPCPQIRVCQLSVSCTENKHQTVNDCKSRQDGRYCPYFILSLQHPSTTQCTDLQHHEPPGKLLFEILPLPCPNLAAVVVRCCGSREQLRQIPKGGRLCISEDGGGTERWYTAWAHHELERDENTQAAGDS